MRIGIIGAGAIAHGIFALLKDDSNSLTMWSPSDKMRPKKVKVTGILDQECDVEFAASAERLVVQSDVLIFALPVNGHKSTMDAIAPYVQCHQEIIISSQLSFSAVYLHDLLVARNCSVPIYAWNTTPLTSKQTAANAYNVSTLRKTINVFHLSEGLKGHSRPCYKALFPSTFIKQDSLLDITFENLNPQVHMGMVLCNLTRMEKAESWCQRDNVTPAVGRLIEAIDTERLTLAEAFGRNPKSIMENYASMGLEGASVSEINRILHEARSVWGPKTSNTRYVTEDVPYGLWTTVKLGEIAGIATPLHTSAVNLFSALYGRDFRSENEIIPNIDLNIYSAERLMVRI